MFNGSDSTLQLIPVAARGVTVHLSCVKMVLDLAFNTEVLLTGVDHCTSPTSAFTNNSLLSE